MSERHREKKKCCGEKKKKRDRETKTERQRLLGRSDRAVERGA